MKRFWLLLGVIVVILLFKTDTAWAGGVQLDYTRLELELEEYLKGQQGTYGVYVQDMRTGAWMGINEAGAFHAASTFKLYLNLYLYEQIAAGRVNPQAKLTFLEKHAEGGTGYLQHKPLGSQFTVAELSRASIVYSDNVATNMLLDYLGRANVKTFMKRMGCRVVDYRRNITCPGDAALCMRQIVEFSRKHPDLGRQLMYHLSHTVFNERIPAKLPSGIMVAHKIGNWPPTGSYHDVGYVQHPAYPYVIALYSKNTPSFQYACRVLSEISRRVYEFHNDPVYNVDAVDIDWDVWLQVQKEQICRDADQSLILRSLVYKIGEVLSQRLDR
ncbi:MAG: serine hydrolase [Peptococcaceae bacterium]|nr:serine hydrolase [Peptococcaceae bacterium]